MANLCETLIKSQITADCANPIVRGLEADGIIINRSDIDFASCTIANNTISTLVLNSGKTGYAVYQMGNTPFTGTTTSLTTGTYKNKFTNNVVVAVLDNGPSVSSDIIDGLANGSFVVILRNRHKGTSGDSEYQVYGFYQGLTASAIENDKYSEDLDGGWLVTLTETNAPKSAMFFFNTDSTTTAAAYAALL